MDATRIVGEVGGHRVDLAARGSADLGELLARLVGAGWCVAETAPRPLVVEVRAFRVVSPDGVRGRLALARETTEGEPRRRDARALAELNRAAAGAA